MSQAKPPVVSWRLARLLLLLAVVGLGGFAVSLALLVRGAGAPAVDELAPRARQQLVEELLAASPGLYRWAYFEPRIGYTLHPGREREEWDSTVVANELGYRAPPAAKAEGTFRILLVGDSWTFGMGVEREESYGEQLAGLVRRHAGLEAPVEGWNLALPGYNTLNELAALWYFYDRLQPDAVVVCVSGNDNHSTYQILPNGSQTAEGVLLDLFGDPHHVMYRGRYLDSYRYRERWRQAFAAIRETELALRRRGVPMVVFFLARFEDPEPHARIVEAGIESTYVVAPRGLTKGRWSNPRWGHGTPEANGLYAEMVYRGLATELGWPALPGGHRKAAEAEVHASPPAGVDWLERQRQREKAITARDLPARWRPSSRPIQVVGPLDAASGEMGRATTLLVRHRPGAAEVEVGVRRLDDAPSLYPLKLEISIPSPAGGSRVVVEVAADGPARQRFRVPVPADLEPGCALDVTLVAGRTVAAAEGFAARSLVVEAIDNVVE